MSSRISLRRVFKDDHFSNLFVTDTLKIPRFTGFGEPPAFGEVGDTPGMQGNIILDKATGLFCWHNGVTWKCVETTTLTGMPCSPPVAGTVNLVVNGVGPNLQISDLAPADAGITLTSPGNCVRIANNVRVTNASCAPAPLGVELISGTYPAYVAKGLVAGTGVAFDDTSDCITIDAMGPLQFIQETSVSLGSTIDNLRGNNETPYTENGVTSNNQENFLYGSGVINSDGTSVTTGSGFNATRMYFISAGQSLTAQGAFRAGISTTTRSDLVNVGRASVSFGEGNLASGSRSAALGGQNNQIAGVGSASVGGILNTIDVDSSESLVSGNTNAITDSDNSVIVGGHDNIINTADNSFMAACVSFPINTGSDHSAAIASTGGFISNGVPFATAATATCNFQAGTDDSNINQSAGCSMISTASGKMGTSGTSSGCVGCSIFATNNGSIQACNYSAMISTDNTGNDRILAGRDFCLQHDNTLRSGYELVRNDAVQIAAFSPATPTVTVLETTRHLYINCDASTNPQTYTLNLPAQLGTRLDGMRLTIKDISVVSGGVGLDQNEVVVTPLAPQFIYYGAGAVSTATYTIGGNPDNDGTTIDLHYIDNIGVGGGTWFVLYDTSNDTV